MKADDIRDDAHRPVARVRRAIASALLAVAGTALSSASPHAEAQTPPASSTQVAPGVVRPGPTRDEADMTRRPTGIDAEFVDKAAMIGKTVVQASRLALDRSANRQVKAFAQRMVDDHERIAGTLRQIGADKGVPVQTRMLVDPALTALRKRSGPAFDAGYLELAGPRAHEAAIRVYEAEARDGRDPQLRAFATSTVPALRAHLAAARQLARKIGATH
ncbi:DUF4142 domain-containing protein [Burkholderia pseudomultivorans]|uniref:DUF305 domain-containing protein n=1 Tax=Burkholderia pseudomultivorans TaxID=1207504 RepID=A0A132ENA2_9BURK|nr:DUF4142 domain-containing protein [Burkholderia pseudomultivorans]KWF38018.1 DUF305 domain-containing protein [Burkholderia pseudomultivorans]